MTTIDPNLDGIEHINIYSEGRTEVGRLLSNFAYSPFIHPEDGRFDSVEGYWYWLLTDGHFMRDNLRFLHGRTAKFTGRRMTNTYDPVDEDEVFKNKIRTALRCKVEQNPEIKNAILKFLPLPFVHYYVYDDGAKVVIPTSHTWIIDEWEEIRSELKGETLF